MRAFLFLLPLAAHAAANPCDPACDPKAKAKASVAAVACEPHSVVHTHGAGSAPVRVHVSGNCATKAGATRSTSPALVSVGQGGSCSAAPTSVAYAVAAGSAPRSGIAFDTTTSATPSGDPVVVRLEGEGESLSALAEIVRRTREGDVQVHTLDEATREEIRAAVEGAREAAREALESAREAQRDAQEEMREAMRDAESTQREALRAAREAQREAGLEGREIWNAVRAAQEAQGGFDPADLEAMTRDAWQSAHEALAAAGLGYSKELAQGFGASQASKPAKSSAPKSQELEDRIRALERIAREQGHDTTDGSLEDRVEALERALGARETKTLRPRTPRAQGGGTMRGYTLQDDGQVREFRVPSRAPEAKTSPRTVIVTPIAPTAPVPPIARVRPTPPVPPVAPVAPTAPSAGQGTWLHSGPPAASRSRYPSGAEPSNDERRAIEEAMRELRTEAEALRAEVQRMREKVDSLPRDDAR